MLAGIIASPSAFDPKVYPENALGAAQPGAGKDGRTGLHHARPVRRRHPQGPPRPGRHQAADAGIARPLLHRLPAPAAGRTLRPGEGLLRRPRSPLDARPAAPGSGRRSGQLLPRLLARDRLGRRHRRPHRRDQGDGRRARLRNSALQPGDPGAAPAGLLDQALHAADGARRGDLTGNRIPLRTADLPLRQARRRNLHRPQRRRRLPRLLLDRLRPDLLRQLDLRRARRWKGWKARRSRTAPARSPRRSTRRATTTRSRPTRRWCSAA